MKVLRVRMETHLTLDNIADQFDLKLDGDTSRMIANMLTLIAKKRGDSLQVARKRTKVNGNYQSYKVTAYPQSYVNLFEQLCLLMDIWKDGSEI